MYLTPLTIGIPTNNFHERFLSSKNNGLIGDIDKYIFPKKISYTRNTVIQVNHKFRQKQIKLTELLQVYNKKTIPF